MISGLVTTHLYSITTRYTPSTESPRFRVFAPPSPLHNSATHLHPFPPSPFYHKLTLLHTSTATTHYILYYTPDLCATSSLPLLYPLTLLHSYQPTTHRSLHIALLYYYTPRSYILMIISAK